MADTIKDWIKGKDILVTGGFGFVGKGLTEKLLRTTEVNKIYLIIRAKKNQRPADRWQQMSQDMVFDRLRSENPNALNKVTIVEGDMAATALGLSHENKEILVNNVSVIFHAAACVRFDDPLSNAILVNIKGTKELIDLAKSMKKLECFQYVSTAYSNCNLNIDVIEEKIYNQNYDWRSLLKMAEENPTIMNLLEKKILGTHPNTYTMCKSVTEMLLEEHKNDLPIVIFRPSVIVGSASDPEPGWVDNFNGPMSVGAGLSSGLMRVFRATTDDFLDYVTIDRVINGMIVTAWKTSKNCSNGIEIFNCVYINETKHNFLDIFETGIRQNKEFPFDNNIWYPFMYICQNTYKFHLLFILLQAIPGFLIDLFIILFGKKPILTKLTVKIYLANTAIYYFSSRTIKFDCTKYKKIFNILPKEDQNIFILAPLDLPFDDMMLIFVKGVKKFLLKQKESDVEKFRAKLNRLYYIHMATKIMFFSAVTYLLVKYLLIKVPIISTLL